MSEFDRRVDLIRNPRVETYEEKLQWHRNLFARVLRINHNYEETRRFTKGYPTFECLGQYLYEEKCVVCGKTRCKVFKNDNGEGSI